MAWNNGSFPATGAGGQSSQLRRFLAESLIRGSWRLVPPRCVRRSFLRRGVADRCRGGHTPQVARTSSEAVLQDFGPTYPGGFATSRKKKFVSRYMAGQNIVIDDGRSVW
jgi:hypothetical protein